MGLPSESLLDEVVSVAIKAEFHANGLSLEEGSGQSAASPAHSSYHQPHFALTLNEQEQDRIRELYQASRSLDEPMEKEVPVHVWKQTSVYHIHHLVPSRVFSLFLII